MKKSKTNESKVQKPFIRMVEELFLFFLIVSFIGWVYEVVLEVVICKWEYSDRGVLTGPYCVVYGAGALLLLVFRYIFRNKKFCIGRINIKPILAFVGIIVVTTVVELVASYIMEWTTGTWMWDYSIYAYDFEGRIAPKISIIFGFGGMAIFYVIYPLFNMVMKTKHNKIVHMVAAVLMVVFAMDCINYLIN